MKTKINFIQYKNGEKINLDDYLSEDEEIEDFDEDD